MVSYFRIRKTSRGSNFFAIVLPESRPCKLYSYFCDPLKNETVLGDPLKCSVEPSGVVKPMAFNKISLNTTARNETTNTHALTLLKQCTKSKVICSVLTSTCD